MPVRKAGAKWEGGLKGGKGTITSETGAVSGAYTFGSRFESGKGTNPEELLAASHAACFSMALSGGLEKAGKTPTSVTTEATCTVERVESGFKVTKMQLTTRAVVPGISNEEFQKIAAGAKDGCPISGAIKGNVEITLDAKLA